MGKDLGADLEIKKATYLSHFGLKESKAYWIINLMNLSKFLITTGTGRTS